MDRLQQELEAITARLAAATTPAEKESLERTFGERLNHLRGRLAEAAEKKPKAPK